MLGISQGKTSFLIALNIAGIGLLTFFHPYIKHAKSPVTEWLYMASLPIAAAAVCFGLYALISRQRARGSWPMGFLMLAWLFAVSNVASPYISKKNSPVQDMQTSLPRATEPVRYLTDEEVGFPPAKR